MKLYPDELFPKQMLVNVAVFRKPHPPLLIIHGTADKAISYKNALDLFNQAQEPKILLTVKDGPHGSFGTMSDFEAALKSLLQASAKRVY